MLMGALALRASIASYLSHTCGCSTRTDDSSTSIGTSDTIYQQGVGGWVKRKRSRGSTAPPHGTPRQQSRRGFLKCGNKSCVTDTTRSTTDLVCASFPCTFYGDTNGLRESSRSLGYACFLGYLVVDDETRHVS